MQERATKISHANTARLAHYHGEELLGRVRLAAHRVGRFTLQTRLLEDDLGETPGVLQGVMLCTYASNVLRSMGWQLVTSIHTTMQ